MATLHIIVGLPCSGKSTYATDLQRKVNGVVFSLDYWLIALFGRYSLVDEGHEEHVRRVLAVRGLTWNVASQLLSRGTDVILDDGFFLREHRMQLIRDANRCGAAARIHLTDVPVALVRERLAKRNACLPVHNFFITTEVFDAFVNLFEVPSANEGAELLLATQNITA